MRYAIPLVQGRLSAHFGHCEVFALIDVEDGKISNRSDETPPPHEPGVLPKWLGEKGANVIIAGGMGAMAIQMFQAQGLDVMIGAQSIDPEELVKSHIAGTLKSGENLCDSGDKPCGSDDKSCRH